MANFRLTAKKDFPGDTIKAGDTIVIRGLNFESNIHLEHVREALETQLGKKMSCGYRGNTDWIITKF